MTNVETLLFSIDWTNNPVPNQVPSYIDVAHMELCQ
jgi:hypothetical protein